MTLKVHPTYSRLRQGSGEGGLVSLDILGDVDLESSLGKDLSPEWSELSYYPLYLLQGLRQRRLCSQDMFSAFQELT